MGRSLDNPINWSIGAGRLFGIAIRVHILFLFGALVVIAQAFRENPDGGITGIVESLGAIALMFLIVLVHEFGHCFGARGVGGSAEEILMWPLGGLATVRPPHRPGAHLVTALAGPAVNVVFCLVTAAVLIAWTGNALAVPTDPFHMFRPLSPEGFDMWPVQKWLVIFFGLNYMILLFNLAPVYPLDGGQALQALLWPRMGYRDSMMLASGIGMVGAIGFGVIGIFSGAYMLFGIAVFGYFTCWQQRQQLKMGLFENGGGLPGYDFSQGHTSLDRSAAGPSFWQRRRARKLAERRRRERERIEAARQEVDRILDKISRDGLRSLSPKERRFLERETQRQSSHDRPRY